MHTEAARGTMTVVADGVPTKNGARPVTGKTLAEKIAEAKLVVAALKDTSCTLSPEEEEYAALCAEKNALYKKNEEQAAATLLKRAQMIEAEVRDTLPDRGAQTEIVCFCDRSTEKRCGIGVIVVKAHEGDAAVNALASSNKLNVNDKGEASFDPLGMSSKTPAMVLDGLLKCAVYPTDKDALTLFVTKSYGFALAAYEAASGLTGRHAQVVTGKSTS